MSKCRYTRSSSGGTATAPVTEGAWRPIYAHEFQVSPLHPKQKAILIRSFQKHDRNSILLYK